jgi:hypothetical protein
VQENGEDWIFIRAQKMSINGEEISVKAHTANRQKSSIAKREQLQRSAGGGIQEGKGLKNNDDDDEEEEDEE